MGHMTAPDKQNTAHPGPDALSQRMREHGIEAFRPLDINGPRSLFRGRDSDQRCDVLVVEVQPAAALEPADVGPSDAPLHAPKTHITLPYRVLQIGERSFGLFSQVKGMTLRENTDMMAKLRIVLYSGQILSWRLEEMLFRGFLRRSGQGLNS